MMLIDVKRFGDGISRALGYAIESPVPVLLGGYDDDGNKVLRPAEEDRDDTNVYFFHELPNAHPFRGEASNSGLSPLSKQDLKWGNPVYVKHDPVTGAWVLAGTVPKLSDEYQEDSLTTPPQPVQLAQITAGLLDQTEIASMQARVLSAPYSIGTRLYVPATVATANFSLSPLDTAGNAITIPTDEGMAKYVLVQIKAETGVLSYKQGAQFPAELSHNTMFSVDAGQGVYFPIKDADKFRTGFIKLIKGMTQILRTVNIWSAQELITQASADELLDRVLVDSAGQILVDSDGNIMLESI